MDEDKNPTDSGQAQGMIAGKWKCAECGTEITELPFEPSGDRPVYCRDCWLKKRDQRRGGFKPRKMFQGNWKCVDCGTKITELPFEPVADQEVRCRECWRKAKGQ